MRLNINNFRNTLKTVLEYLFPVEKVTSYFKSINSKEDLQKFIQQRSAHITQNTLYGYLKTRMGHKFTIMVDDDVYSKSINIAKWNIYMASLADLTFYASSYLMNEKNLKEMLPEYMKLNTNSIKGKLYHLCEKKYNNKLTFLKCFE